MTTRQEEFQAVKKLIEENYEYGCCGLFNCRNVCGDTMELLYYGDYFSLEICRGYLYFEVFGTTKEEFAELEKYYNELGEKKGRK